MLWILYILGACVAWGVSEILSDVCIEQTMDEEEDGHDKGAHVEPPSPSRKKGRRLEPGANEAVVDMQHMFSSNSPQVIHGFASGKMTGEQSAIVSAISMLVCTVVMNIFMADDPIFAWDTPVWRLSAVAGVLNGVAYLLLFKAYETAPSTVLIPLMQLTALMMLVTSTVVALISPYFPTILSPEENGFISLRECLAYAIILFGALFPAAHGNFHQFTLPSFWNQPYVIFILCNDFLVAIVYELMGLSTSDLLGSSPEHFIMISSYFTSATMISLFLFNKAMRRHVTGLSHVTNKYLAICVVSEILNWTAYWFATYAYKVHEANISVVGAAEVALNQVVNLAIAFILKVFLDVGRDSSIDNIQSKVLSALCITAGIIFTSMSGKPRHASGPRDVKIVAKSDTTRRLLSLTTRRRL